MIYLFTAFALLAHNADGIWWLWLIIVYLLDKNA